MDKIIELRPSLLCFFLLWPRQRESTRAILEAKLPVSRNFFFFFLIDLCRCLWPFSRVKRRADAAALGEVAHAAAAAAVSKQISIDAAGALLSQLHGFSILNEELTGTEDPCWNFFDSLLECSKQRRLYISSHFKSIAF